MMQNRPSVLKTDLYGSWGKKKASNRGAIYLHCDAKNLGQLHQTSAQKQIRTAPSPLTVTHD
jgi:hypothetical protein